jgi:hypothetical protein
MLKKLWNFRKVVATVYVILKNDIRKEEGGQERTF